MKRMKDSEYSQRILGLSRGIFDGDFNEDEQKLVVEAMKEYSNGNYVRIDEILERLEYRLLEVLVVKLKGKSTYTGLEQLVEGKDQSDEQAIISIASLISRVGIELKESNRYRILLPTLYKKLGTLINKQGWR